MKKKKVVAALYGIAALVFAANAVINLVVKDGFLSVAIINLALCVTMLCICIGYSKRAKAQEAQQQSAEQAPAEPPSAEDAHE